MSNLPTTYKDWCKRLEQNSIGPEVELCCINSPPSSSLQDSSPLHKGTISKWKRFSGSTARSKDILFLRAIIKETLIDKKSIKELLITARLISQDSWRLAQKTLGLTETISNEEILLEANEQKKEENQNDEKMFENHFRDLNLDESLSNANRHSPITPRSSTSSSQALTPKMSSLALRNPTTPPPAPKSTRNIESTEGLYHTLSLPCRYAKFIHESHQQPLSGPPQRPPPNGLLGSFDMVLYNNCNLQNIKNHSRDEPPQNETKKEDAMNTIHNKNQTSPSLRCNQKPSTQAITDDHSSESDDAYDSDITASGNQKMDRTHNHSVINSESEPVVSQFACSFFTAIATFVQEQNDWTMESGRDFRTHPIVPHEERFIFGGKSSGTKGSWGYEAVVDGIFGSKHDHPIFPLYMEFKATSEPKNVEFQLIAQIAAQIYVKESGSSYESVFISFYTPVINSQSAC